MPLRYWEYFLSIESDLDKCSRYVDFSSNNFDTYSVEFARIIMAAAAEFDTVAKAFCRLIDPASNARNISEYADKILQKYLHFIDIEMTLYRYDIPVKPWALWSSTNSPSWWQAYNKIKHDRTAHFDLANLENAINAVAGLLSGILYFYYEKNGGKNEEISSFSSPRLLDVVDNRPSDGWVAGGIFWGYHLP